MKKSGFSLAEVLITMAVIAISASMLIPAYINLKPDKYKFKVLNCYKALNEVTEDLLGNSDLYYQSPAPETLPDDYYIHINPSDPNSPEIVNPNKVYNCQGLACMQMPNTCEPDNHPLHEFCDNHYRRPAKYPNLLVDFLQLEEKHHCNGFCNSAQNSASGISSNRIKWIIYSPNASSPISQVAYRVTVDMNRDDSPNCSYNSSNCKHPDRFVFMVDSGGDITGFDELTKQYLRNMTNIRKESDYEAVQGG